MPEKIAYTVRFPTPETHCVEIEAQIPTAGQPSVELMMAVWTPGSYMVREFARHVERITARDARGRSLPVRKSRKNRWVVDPRGASAVTVSYRLYCRELSVRTNFVDAGFALLNGAATFLTLVADGRRPHQVTIEPATGWRRVLTALPEVPGCEHTFLAADFDQLVDSPIYAGDPVVHDIEVGSVPHLLINEGEDGLWDGLRSAADAERIIRQHRQLWRSFPYQHYLFFNVITEVRGGLEHKDSSVLMVSRWGSRTREGYLGWLYLVSHELFHAWHGKRLRPAEMGPFDYEAEVYSRSLWVIEGITSYYDDLLVHRAGLSTREEYLEARSQAIERLQTSYGRHVQPLEASSFDAWIKYYRRDENSGNSTVSYYNKGDLVAWLLDVEVRRATGDAKSLDDVLRLAYQRFSGERGFSPEEFTATAEEVAGRDLSGFFHHCLATTEELDYRPALDWFGLRFVTAESYDAEAAAERGWLGLGTEVCDGRLAVTEVHRGTPAYQAGFNAGDEILAIDGYRVPPRRWEERLTAYRPGQRAEVLVARRERLIALKVTFGLEPEPCWTLEEDPEASTEQRRHLDRWLRPSRGG